MMQSSRSGLSLPSERRVEIALCKALPLYRQSSTALLFSNKSLSSEGPIEFLKVGRRLYTVSCRSEATCLNPRIVINRSASRALFSPKLNFVGSVKETHYEEKLTDLNSKGVSFPSKPTFPTNPNTLITQSTNSLASPSFTSGLSLSTPTTISLS